MISSLYDLEPVLILPFPLLFPRGCIKKLHFHCLLLCVEEQMVGWLLLLVGMLGGKLSMLQGVLSVACRSCNEEGVGRNAWRALGSSEESSLKFCLALMCPCLYWMILPTLFHCSSFSLGTWLSMFQRLGDSYSNSCVPPCWKMVFICYQIGLKNLSEKSDIVYSKLLYQSKAKCWVFPLLGNWPLRKRSCLLPAQFRGHISNTCNNVLCEFLIHHY